MAGEKYRVCLCFALEQRDSKQRKTNCAFKECLGCTEEGREHGGDVKGHQAT